MSDLSIPRFLSLRLERRKKRRPMPVAVEHQPVRHLDKRLAAAVRYDYEVALLSMADVVHKYRLVISAATARDIMNGLIYPEVKSAHHALAWCKRSWRI